MKSVRQIAIFIVIGVIASYLLLPSQQEAEAMRLGSDTAVSAELTSELLVDQSTWSALSVHALAHKFVANEQYSEAITLMEGFVARQPKDVEAIRFLASLYQKTERYEAYGKTLETLLVLAPSVEVLHQLSELYPMLGEKDKEYGILTRLIKEGHALLPRERLAYGIHLALAQPASAKAASLMLETFQTAPELFDMVARQIMLRQLVALSRHNEALQVLQATYAPPALSREGLAMAEWLANSVDQGLAREFVGPFTQVSADDSDWFAQTLRDINATAQLKEFWALRLNDPTLDETVQTQILNGLIDIGAADRTLTQLSSKAANGQEEWLWLYRQALEQAGQLNEWPEFLARSMQAQNLPVSNLHTLATLLIAESPERAVEVLAAHPRRTAEALLEDYLYALERMPANKRRAEYVIDILEKTSFVGERRQALMALLISATPESQAIDWLRTAATNEDQDARQHLEAWLQQPGRESAWRDWCKAQVRSATLSLEQKRQYAHVLLNSGYKQDAIEAFQLFAAQSGPHGSDVETLLYLAGPRPDAATLAWLTQQAESAQGESLIGWLSHLLSVGAGQQVLKVTESIAGTGDADVMLMRLGALADMNDEPAFLAHYASALQQTPSLDWLDQAGRYAQQARFTSAAGKISGELCQRDNRRLKECREAGQLAFVRGDHAQARRALETYLTGTLHGKADQNAPLDAEPLFYLAESCAAQGDQHAAGQHYKQALSMLKASGNSDMKALRMRAYILYRMGRHEEANIAYETVLKHYPDADDVKADYAASLLAQQSYDRALYVLQ